MDELTKVRLATIIDCEGSISLYWNRDGNEYYNRAMVTVSNNEKWYVVQFKKIFGFGTIGKCGVGMKCWSWHGDYIQAYIVCMILHDYFQLKQKNAERIIQYYQKRAKSPTYHLDNKLKEYKAASFISDELQKLQELQGDKNG